MVQPAYNNNAIAQKVTMLNFAPALSASLAVAGTSASVTFSPITSQLRSTFKITNKGTHGAYVAWGTGSATAVVSTSTPTVNCDYVAAGAILTQDFYTTTNGAFIDTIAAIQDTGSTTLEISYGAGQ